MTNEIIKRDLMQYMNYSEGQAEYLIMIYDCNCELDDLIAAVDAKKESCSRL